MEWDCDLWTDYTEPVAGAVAVRLVERRTLHRAAFRRAGGKRGGRASWWLRRILPRGAAGFLTVDLGEGTEPVDCTLHLPPGLYVLGVGTGADAIHQRFTVPGPPAEGRKEADSKYS